MSSSLQVLNWQLFSISKVLLCPFQKHSVYAKTNLLVLELDNVKKYKEIKHDLVPRKKLCRKCKGKLDNVFDVEMENRKDPDYVDEESKIDCSLLSLNTSLVSLERSPLKAVRKERAER